MNENKNYLKNYDLVSEDVKFAVNSVIRLKILTTLFEKPQNMKELATNTKLGYSSISNILHGLELKDFAYRKSNKYYLANSLMVQMRNVLELNEIIHILNKFFSIIDGHTVDMIPDQSVLELHLIENADLLESDGIDAYKILDFIEGSLENAKWVQCILPFYHLNVNKKLNSLIKNGRFVEVMASKEVFEIYEKKSNIKYLSSFNGRNNFLLIVTDNVMILGFFKENGYFDQNRLLTCEDDEAIKWAENLFKNFKNRNK